MKKIHRRKFLAVASASTVAACSFPAPALLASASPNEEIRTVVLGTGNKGREHATILNRLHEEKKPAKLAGVCEVDSTRLARAVEEFKPEKRYSDPRAVFDDKDVDAVTIATPNHWHCLGSIWAMEAGKHVYVEKPLCLTFWEGRQLFNASRKYRKCVQIGSQMRTDRKSHMEVKKFLHEEKALGKILSVRVNRYFVRRPIGLRQEPLSIPPEVNYDLWLGPAKDLPLFRKQLHYDWHFMWNTGNGETGNWGAHLLDDCRNDVFLNKLTLPKRVFACGGRLGVKDAGETPNTMFTYFDSGSVPVIFGFSGVENRNARGKTCPYSGPDSGYVVYGEGGTFVRPWGTSAAFDKDGKKIREFASSEYWKGTYEHILNFIESVQMDDPSNLNGEIQYGFDTSFWYNSANTAWRLSKTWSREKAMAMVEDSGKLGEMLDDMKTYLQSQDISLDETFTLSPLLTLDAETRRFVGENADEANALMDARPGRGAFMVPEVSLN